MMKDFLILDTHIWIWVLNNNIERLSTNCLSAIERASESNNLGLSAISVWEVGMLEAKKRVTFEKSCIDWVQDALSAPGLSLIPLTPEIAIKSTRLPGGFHGDPADRILAATTQVMNAVLVTCDRKLLEYGKQGFISTLPLN
ncbi:type II toxin-antitoxin system VapC family toxin [Brunnivagina elsteri]|uniref:PIN domain nuclease n=1 Tax=Brunnivagina elsteri CCALA 953 TaxID=987040 RepID=A0A2A2TKM5_9CYAN|nr:type II toxin-antitoxin system VapC family toxin [Calothrix elsteri]PAX56958.1 PIN domain nuclease [Calothrix elsteri CCALA 953]